MRKPAAIYARVSSDRQRESETIASQTTALQAYAETHAYLVSVAKLFNPLLKHGLRYSLRCMCA